MDSSHICIAVLLVSLTSCSKEEPAVISFREAENGTAASSKAEPSVPKPSQDRNAASENRLHPNPVVVQTVAAVEPRPASQPRAAKADAVSVEILSKGQAAPAPSGAEVTVAIIDFADKGPSVELARLRTALAEMLTGDLSQYQGLRVVERMRVSQFLNETDLGKSGLAEGETAQKAGQTLAADYLLTGSFSGRGEDVTVEATLLKVGQDEPVAKWKLNSPAAQVIGLGNRLSTAVRDSLGLQQAVLRAPPEAKQGPSPTVAVLALRNLGTSDRLQPLESGFADILQAHLAALKDVRLVEREKLHQVLQEQKLSAAQLADPDTAVKVGKLLGAQRLIYGSFFELGDDLRIDVRLADTQTASVLRAESSSGPSENFADQMEALSLRLAADLAISPPENASKLIQDATPARTLEAVLHFANGLEAFRHTRFPAAATDFERAMLVEPNNIHAAYWRTQTWFFARDWEKAIEAGNQALALQYTPEQIAYRTWLHYWLTGALWPAAKYGEFITASEAAIKESPNAEMTRYYKSRIPFALTMQGRGAEAVAGLERAINEAKVSGGDEAYAAALGDLLSYYDEAADQYRPTQEFISRGEEPEYAQKLSRQSKEWARKAVELVDRILEAAEGKQGPAWSRLGQHAFGAIHGASYFKEDGRGSVLLLSEEEKEQYLKRIGKVFESVPGVDYRSQLILARRQAESEQWSEALESYQKLMSGSPFVERDVVPADSDGWIHQELEFLYQVAHIQQVGLNEPQKAIEEYQKYVRQYGVINHRGKSVVSELESLGADVPLPRNATLIWGGRKVVHRAWKALLEPLGQVVHRVEQSHLSAAHLAPYSLVVLVRMGDRPLEPSDVLALRSYVASGGSLLIVVTAGWELGSPGIHNSLLTFFDSKAGGETTLRSKSTKINPHPITNGIDAATAKCSVALTVPAEAALIQSGDRTVLAAMPYRNGKVVIASFGQWYLPDSQAAKAALPVVYIHWTAQLPVDELPIEQGTGLELPLLNNVVHWLLEPNRDTPEFAKNRKAFQDAWYESLKCQFLATPRDHMLAAMNRLISETDPGLWREEALWAAGEASQYLYYDTNGVEEWEAAEYNLWLDHPVPFMESSHYQRLLSEFADSPLQPYAAWRLAEGKRRQFSYKDGNEYQMKDGDDPQLAEAVALFKEVKAEPGSFAWAWRELRLGQCLHGQKDFAGAAEHFQSLVEKMETCPEKSLALQGLGLCLMQQGNKQEARRYFELLRQMPDFGTLPDFEFWTHIRPDGMLGLGTCRQSAVFLLRDLGQNVD
ncbi:MAG: CsgG/HfaB family protein [Planctomycetaceae bacterium]